MAATAEGGSAAPRAMGKIAAAQQPIEEWSARTTFQIGDLEFPGIWFWALEFLRRASAWRSYGAPRS
jgi:hypothetical protein